MTNAAPTADLVTYRPVGTSAQERMNTPDTCGCCGREGLKTTVKLADSAGHITWMGTGCAAKAMGIGVDIFRKLAKAADTAAEADARREFFRRQAEEDAAWQSFLDAAAGPGDRMAQIKALGGISAARTAFEAA